MIIITFFLASTGSLADGKIPRGKKHLIFIFYFIARKITDKDIKDIGPHPTTHYNQVRLFTKNIIRPNNIFSH